MKIVITALAAAVLALTTACSGNTNTTAESNATSSDMDQVQTDPEPAVASIEEPNLADDFNQAWVDLAAAQKAYDALGATENATESEITTVFVNEVGSRLEEVRAAWRAMETEAHRLRLPETFTTKGEMSRGTVDEYMAAYDDYLTMQEDSYARTQQCIAEGGGAYGCTLKEGIAFLSDPEYVTAWERLRDATYAIYEETEQPKP